MTSPGPKKPHLIGVDFSDLKRVLKELELKAKKKDCEYCQRPMKQTHVSLEEGEVHFKCENCGWECIEMAPGGYDD